MNRASRRVADDPLPDLDALRRVEPQGIRLGDAEGLVEGVQVADDLVAPELGGGVGVGGEVPPHEFVALLALPDRRPAEEQALRRGVAVDRLAVRVAARLS